MKSSPAPKTSVCILRIEKHNPGGVRITVTTTPDIETFPRGEARTVASCNEALCLVASFLQQCGWVGNQQPHGLD